MGFWRRWLTRRPTRRAWIGPTPEAIDAAAAYYDGLYHDRRPDPQAFSRLLDAHGIPDWPNPYALGDPAHYRLHPDGFLMADLEAILQGMLDDRVEKEDAPSPENEPAIISAARRADMEQEKFIAGCRDRARHCWALLLAHGQPAPRLASIVHPDNLWLVNMDILNQAMQGAWEDVDPARVAEGMKKFSFAS